MFTLVAISGLRTGKYGFCKDSMVQTTILEHAFIGVKSAHQGQICNIPHTTLSGELDCPLGLV